MYYFVRRLPHITAATQIGTFCTSFLVLIAIALVRVPVVGQLWNLSNENLLLVTTLLVRRIDEQSALQSQTLTDPTTRLIAELPR